MNTITIFQNAFLMDGTGKDPVSDASVVIEDHLIREVDPFGKSHVPNARVIDLRGKTLMPGLIDAHVHPGNVELFLTDTAKLPPAVYVHRVTRTLETDLAMGFTTLRDAGGLDDGFRAAVNQGLINGPRLFLCVTPLTQSGGYGDMPPPPRNSLGIHPEVCDGTDEIRRAVRNTLGRGADHIKIFADGEVMSQSPHDRAKPGQWKFSVEELRMAVETAKSAGAYVMAHVYGNKAIQNCLNAGVRSIEHGNLLDGETARMMAEKGAYYVPTLTAYEMAYETGNHERDPAIREKLEIVGKYGKNALELAFTAGVRIGSGSDIIGPDQHLKGRELVMKAEILSPMGAILSATKTNAELMGLDDHIGTLAPGKRADLIIPAGNPLEDMGIFEHAVEKMLLVMKDGKIFKDLLSKRLSKRNAS